MGNCFYRSRGHAPGREFRVMGSGHTDSPVRDTATLAEVLTEKHPTTQKDEDLSPQIDCQLCGKVEYSGEDVIPHEAGNIYRLTLASPGLFWCQKTGIKFQVTGPVVIDYNLESWSDYLEEIVGDTYDIIGPLFNITTDRPQMISAVHLPHYLCLKAFTGDLAGVKCAHFKDGNMTLETPTHVEPFYIIFENPVFSCLGPLLSLVKKKTPIHGMVFIYFRIVCPGEPEYQEYKIHLYLLPSTIHVVEILNKKKEKVGFRRIEKPPQTTTKIYTKQYYLISGLPEAYVAPQMLQFKASEDPYEFTEISIKGGDIDILIYVEEEDIEEKVWSAKLTKGDIKDISRLQSVPPVPESPSSPSEHFVDKHREALIERLSHIDPVLDILLGHRLLTQEQYEIIRKKETHQEKMRQLYVFMSIWGNSDKEKLYQAIRRTNEPLIRDLNMATLT